MSDGITDSRVNDLSDNQRNPYECNELVYKHGSSLGMMPGTDHSKTKAEEFCAEMQEKEGGLWDWNFVGGRVMIKHLSKKKFEAINILDNLINGEDDELAQQLKLVREVLLPEREIG